jgi:hypothetical protein
VTIGTGLTLMPDADAGLNQLTKRKNADAGLTFFPVFRHSSIYL